MKEIYVLPTLKICGGEERAGNLELDRSVFKVWSTLSLGMSGSIY